MAEELGSTWKSEQSVDLDQTPFLLILDRNSAAAARVTTPCWGCCCGCWGGTRCCLATAAAGVTDFIRGVLAAGEVEAMCCILAKLRFSRCKLLLLLSWRGRRVMTKFPSEAFSAKWVTDGDEVI